MTSLTFVGFTPLPAAPALPGYATDQEDTQPLHESQIPFALDAFNLEMPMDPPEACETIDPPQASALDLVS